MGWVQFKPCCKFFTYVTETQANLSTYSRKPGYHNLENYNGTIDFEIDTMKKSSPINSKFTFLPLSKPNENFFSSAVSWCSKYCCSVDKNKPNNQNIAEKVKFDKDFNWLGRLFYIINIKINGAIVIFLVSFICGLVCNSFGDIREQFAVATRSYYHYENFN